jgi:hypothetical protein
MIESRKNYRDSRLEFERHINLLIESIESGQMIIQKNLFKPNEGIFKIRYSPNKRINLNTIDEITRTMAMRPAMEKHIKSQINKEEENND